VGKADDWIGSRRPNRPAAWAVLLGLAANVAGLSYICSDGLTFYREEGHVPDTLVASMALTLFCGAASIAAIYLGWSGLRVAKLPAATGRGRATAGIVLGGFGIVWGSNVLMTTLERSYQHKWYGPTSIPRVRCIQRLRAIGDACAQYASRNGGRFPDEFSKLHTVCGLDTSMLLCGRHGPHGYDYPVQDIVDRMAVAGRDTYVYAGAGVTTTAAPSTVLVYEHLQNHDWGIHVLYVDGRVEWLKEERAEKLIAAMQPKLPASGPKTQR
jgi:hypothetical protein